MSSQNNSEGSKVDRRQFCNRALLTSAGIVLMTIKPKAGAAIQHENLVIYPPHEDRRGREIDARVVSVL